MNKGEKVAGEKNGKSKLTNNQVIEIYNSKLSYAQLSRVFNINPSTVYRIKHRLVWKRVTEKLF